MFFLPLPPLHHTLILHIYLLHGAPPHLRVVTMSNVFPRKHQCLTHTQHTHLQSSSMWMDTLHPLQPHCAADTTGVITSVLQIWKPAQRQKVLPKVSISSLYYDSLLDMSTVKHAFTVIIIFASPQKPC